MAHVGGLGTSGRARRVQVERPVRDGQWRALGRAQRLARVQLDRAIDARKFIGARAVGPDLHRPRQVRPRAAQQLDQLCGHDHVPGRDQIDALRERGTGQLGVEQGHDPPNAGQAEPDGQVLRPVRHQ